MSENPSSFVRTAVRYWGGALSLIDDSGRPLPGFPYTPAERQVFAALGADVSLGELAVFVLLNAAVIVGLAAAVVMAGFLPLIKTFYPVLASAPLLPLGTLLAVMFSILAGLGQPLASSIAAGICGKIFTQTAKSEPPATDVRSLFQKLQWQCLRAGILIALVGLMVVTGIFYHQGLGTVLVQTLLRCLLPALGVALLGYFLSQWAASE